MYDSPPMEIRERQDGDVLVFTVCGSLDSDTINDATVRMNTWLDEGKTRFVGDLSSLNYITSAGLLLLFTLGKKAVESGGGLCLCKPKDQVQHVLDVCGLPDKIPVEDSLDEALNKVRT